MIKPDSFIVRAPLLTLSECLVVIIKYAIFQLLFSYLKVFSSNVYPLRITFKEFSNIPEKFKNPYSTKAHIIIH